MDNNAILAQLAIELKSRSTARIALESSLSLSIAIVIIIGNSMTLYIVYKNRNLRTVPNLFIVSLAISDLGMAVLSMPMSLTVLATSHWPFSDVACQYNGFIIILMALASVQSLAWTSINRYFRVVKPNKYRRYFTMKLTTIYIAAFWLFSALATPPYLIAGERMVFHPGKYFCYLQIDVTWYSALIVVLYVGVPTSITLYCYMRVFQTVNKHNKQFTKSRCSSNINLSVEEIKITRTLFVVMLVYMACWTPILIIDLIDAAKGYWSMSREVYTAYSFLAVVSSATNPIIYGLMNPQFKKEYLKILCCRTCACGCSKDNIVRAFTVAKQTGIVTGSQNQQSTQNTHFPSMQLGNRSTTNGEQINKDVEQITSLESWLACSQIEN